MPSHFAHRVYLVKGSGGESVPLVAFHDETFEQAYEETFPEQAIPEGSAPIFNGPDLPDVTPLPHPYPVLNAMYAGLLATKDLRNAYRDILQQMLTAVYLSAQ